MKKILLMFLIGTMSMFSQTTTTVRGVTLGYNTNSKVMTLTISPKTMYTNDANLDVRITINKEFALKMTIGGVDYTMSETYFEHIGHREEMFWYFTTTSPLKCKEIKKNCVYQFKGVERGEEYILSVSDVCDGKYVTKEKTSSIKIK
jgi:hypothetical protein